MHARPDWPSRTDAYRPAVARRAERVLALAIVSIQARPGCEGCLRKVEVDASGPRLPPFAENALAHWVRRKSGHVGSGGSVPTWLTKAPARETGTCRCQQGGSERDRWQPRYEEHAANGPMLEGTLPTEWMTSEAQRPDFRDREKVPFLSAKIRPFLPKPGPGLNPPARPRGDRYAAHATQLAAIG